MSYYHYKMEYRHLTLQEQNILRGLVQSGQLAAKDLPRGIWVGLDSMGPARDPKTDILFSGMPEALHAFAQVMAAYDLGLVVATNGPAKEAHDILNCLDVGIKLRKFGVAEGGGLIVQANVSGTLEERIIAPHQEIEALKTLENAVKDSNPLLKALLENTISDDAEAPIRTPYKTNIALTLPARYTNLQRRLQARGVNIRQYIADADERNYMGKLLEYAYKILSAKMQQLDLTDLLGLIIIKIPNRRLYAPTAHIYDPKGGTFARLSKYNGTVIGAGLGNWEFNLGNAAYIADYAVDRTQGEHAAVLGASERSMIRNGNTQARMAFNITMDSALLQIGLVEGVKILNIGSGAKALEAIGFLYNALYSNAPQRR